ncbi:hypothetical protein SLEP1_g54130 [Rubroshorea leprosula]|uniref:CCHC-type domain-containing protein n=1 Tax=Rubroshorea leprosula TaxID=152421 RepID=A0AAV5MF30_9ROSI|nr:hypothetical protein SLEP1_g54130 [Rubroshorea leprosula]
MATSNDSPNSATSKTSTTAAVTVLNPGLTNCPLSFNSVAFPVKLTPTNYLSWKAQFTSLLAGYELDGYLDGKNPYLVATALEYSLWAGQDQLLRHALITSVSENITPYIAAAAATTQQAWETLAKLYANCSRTRSLHREENRANLTPATAHFAAAPMASSSGMHSSSFMGTSSSQNRNSGFLQPSNRGNRGAQNSTNRNYGNRKCCFGPKFNNRLGNFTCQLCGHTGHFAKNCPNYRVQAVSPMANIASSSVAFSDDCLLDSGANNHVTTDLTNLALHSEYNGPDELQIGDGTGLKITHVGHSTLSTLTSSLPLRNKLRKQHNCIPDEHYVQTNCLQYVKE